MKKLFLIDAYALIFKFYYAFLTRPMRNGEGLNTSPVFGFVKFLRDIIRKESPDYLGVAFDPKGGNFRHRLYPEYKANRSETPEDIILSVPYIKEILNAMHIPVLEIEGYEADDVIGTLSWKAAVQGFDVFMVTPDKDFGQLIRDHVYIYKQKKDGTGVEVIGTEQICANYGIADPGHIVDILALWGDAADNIPGVPGIGEKSAVKLINEFGSVENILHNTDKLKGRQRESIAAAAEQLALSKKLATIDTDAPIEFRPGELVMEEPDPEHLRNIFHKLGFNQFLREMGLGTAPRRDDGPVLRPAGEPEPVVRVPGAERSGAPDPAMQGQGALFSATGTPAPPMEEQELLRTPEQTSEGACANILNTPHKYYVISGPEKLRRMVDHIRKHREFCFDTETTGLDPLVSDVVGISFALKPGEAFYLPMNRENTTSYIPVLKELFEDPDIAKTGQNMKFDIAVLARLGIRVLGFKYDTMILHYLLESESRHNMNFLARTYLNYDPMEIEALTGRGTRQITMDMVPVQQVAEYAGEDADITLRLREVLWPMVVAQGLDRLYAEVEEPLIEVLADMELTGVRIDSSILADYSKHLSAKLGELEAQIRLTADEPKLNINSAQQLGKVLFEKLHIDENPKKTKTGQYRTDEESLRYFAPRHPIVGMVLEYRGVKKLLSTYVDALPQLVDPATGRVHTSYNQAVTSTGRLSSTNPNLQNIPIREEMGREIRKAFVPADDDHLLLSADYSQVELRLMAHLSKDPSLLEAFEKGEDIHAATAARIFNVPPDGVTAEQRRRAKTANFGIIYGISAFGLSQRLGIPRQEAGDIINGYFRSYPGVRRYMESVIEQARTDGYVNTIFGRKRFLPDITSGNTTTRGLAERNAINAPIQGSAADIMKLAMINAHKALSSRSLRSKIILQVHDELLVDMYRPEQEIVTGLIVDAMENAAKLSVRLTADYGIGTNWLEAH